MAFQPGRPESLSDPYDQTAGSVRSSRTSCAQRQATAILAAHSSASSREGTSTTANPPRTSLVSGCDLRDADFRWADLTDAEFGYVMTHDPNYGLTDVTGANWQGACLERVTVDRVIGWPEG